MSKQKVIVRYYPSVNRVRINAKSKEVYKTYLQYKFEILKIPSNATIIFKDKTIQGGIEQWLKQE